MEIQGHERALLAPLPQEQRPGAAEAKERGHDIGEANVRARRPGPGSPEAGPAVLSERSHSPDHQALRQTFFGVTRIAFEGKDTGALDLEKLKESLQEVAAIAARLGVPHQDRIAAVLEEIQDGAESQSAVDLQALHRVILHLAHFARNHPAPDQPAPDQPAARPEAEADVPEPIEVSPSIDIVV